MKVCNRILIPTLVLVQISCIIKPQYFIIKIAVKTSVCYRVSYRIIMLYAIMLYAIGLLLLLEEEELARGTNQLPLTHALMSTVGVSGRDRELHFSI